MAIHRIHQSFTTGEISPLLECRVDFDRYKNSCKVMKNAVALAQGPVVRRSGFRYIHDLNSLDFDIANPKVRMIPFIYDKVQAYVLIFFWTTGHHPRLVFGLPNGTLLEENGAVIYLDIPSSWDIEVMDYAQSADEMYIAQPDVKPHVLVRKSYSSWELDEIVFTDMPTDWSDTNGWPEKVTFHQQRLVFACNKLRKQTVWMSKANSFFDFGKNSPILASDALSFTIASGKQNKIMWMQSGRVLDLGTMGDEWTVTGSNISSITPDNILAQRQTNNGSEAVKPKMIGSTTLYVERFGKTINEFKYDYASDSYISSDTTILSPHLTENYSIKDWTYQQVPYRILWCIREDGDMIGLTYQKEHKVVGWHHHVTDGEFVAITSIPGTTREDDVWVTVRRNINGTDKYYVEKLADFFIGSDSIDGRFLDSYSYVKSDTAFNQLTGLDYLEGKEIHLLVDGSVHPPLIVKQGTVTLNNYYNEVVLGLAYETEIRPNVADIPTQTGTSMGRMQRITNIDIILHKTLGMWIGRGDSEDGDHEEEIPFRQPFNITGEPVPLFSGIRHIDYPEGYDREVDYFIKQKQPLPLTILGVVDTIEVFE
jgi:hypothetical protein